MNRRVSNVRPMRKWVGSNAGTVDWYLVEGRGKRQLAVRKQDIGQRVVIAGPYETKSQALCERTGKGT